MNGIIWRGNAACTFEHWTITLHQQFIKWKSNTFKYVWKLQNSIPVPKLIINCYVHKIQATYLATQWTINIKIIIKLHWEISRILVLKRTSKESWCFSSSSSFSWLSSAATCRPHLMSRDVSQFLVSPALFIIPTITAGLKGGGGGRLLQTAAGWDCSFQ